MTHMSATGVSGIDLYIKDRSRSKSKRYHWIGCGKPEKFPHNEAELVAGLDGQPHEFILYLPLYNGVKKVEIGVDAEVGIHQANCYVQHQHPSRGMFFATRHVLSCNHGPCD